MIIKRDIILNNLIAKKDNGQIKIITGVRRCGKTFLLFNLFKDYLLENNVPENHIITLALDSALNAKYRDPLALAYFLKDQIFDQNSKFYILLDEIQFVKKKKIQSNPDIFVSFYDVLNELLNLGNCDIYVTGSNSMMLSKDVLTEFRGRGDELHISPLTFSEFYNFNSKSKEEAFQEYLYYGGMPAILAKASETEKKEYLINLFKETYLKDILERNKIAYPEVLEIIINELCSSVGSLTNSNKISKTLNSVRNVKIDSETVAKYLEYLTDAYLFSRASRYDIKGKKYFSFPYKYYSVDLGLLNARLNFRQFEETHLMENLIYNELISRGYSVDVGVVDSTDENNKKCSYEIDFVVNMNNSKGKYYIQSAFKMDNEAKKEQEIRPFLKLTKDFTRRIVVSKSNLKPWVDEYGILHLNIIDFLLTKNLNSFFNDN